MAATFTGVVLRKRRTVIPLFLAARHGLLVDIEPARPDLIHADATFSEIEWRNAGRPFRSERAAYDRSDPVVGNEREAGS
jgi:hypothetical protein